MVEQDSTVPKPVSEQVKEKVEEVRPKVEQHLKSYEVRTTVNPVQVLTCVATLGILWTSRRHLKFAKKVIKNMDNNVEGAQQAIKALKAAGQPFTFYPGVGVYID